MSIAFVKDHNIAYNQADFTINGELQTVTWDVPSKIWYLHGSKYPTISPL